MASKITLDLYSSDVGHSFSTATEFAKHLTSLTLESYKTGADIVVFPEYTWMGLEKFVDKKNSLSEISHLFWNQLWPQIKNDLNQPNKVLIMGSCPFLIESTSKFTNRCPILCQEKETFQEKLQLTPWETSFQSGNTINVINFKNLRIAVLICFDIEFPELSLRLKEEKIDLLVVPSACESILGVERVNRCASARAIELGAFVGVSHLLGETESELVDLNLGGLSLYTPSQSPFKDSKRQQSTQIFKKGFHRLRKSLDFDLLTQMRSLKMETNPSLVKV